MYYPYGGTLMPKDPFRFHVRDLLQNIDVEHQNHETANMWPPRDKQLPDPNLQAGSDDIEVDLGDYDYWLPEEVSQGEESESSLSVSER